MDLKSKIGTLPYPILIWYLYSG